MTKTKITLWVLGLLSGTLIWALLMITALSVEKIVNFTYQMGLALGLGSPVFLITGAIAGVVYFFKRKPSTAMWTWTILLLVTLVVIGIGGAKQREVAQDATDAANWPANTTGYLVQACSQPLADADTSTVVAVNLGYCRGMVIGVSAMLSANSELRPRPPFYACVGNANTKTIVYRFIQWAKRNSRRLNEEAPIGFTRYLMDTFPC